MKPLLVLWALIALACTRVYVEPPECCGAKPGVGTTAADEDGGAP